MPSLQILSRDYPQRALALATDKFALIFQHSPTELGPSNQRRSNDSPRCLVEFANLSLLDLKGYRTLGSGFGTLGLVTLDNDVFLCVVTGSSRAATVRPDETVSRIDGVEFCGCPYLIAFLMNPNISVCLNRLEYENGLEYEFGSSFAAEEPNYGGPSEGRELVTDHPFLALKKLLSDGSFYYSLDFNLTDRLQDRSDKSATFDIESLKEDMLWNSYMIHPLLLFRDRLSPLEKQDLDSCQILTCVIRGFSNTSVVPGATHLLPDLQINQNGSLTIISRQSSRRAGTRFNSRGIDDNGHVANFVETELILWIPPGITFSYVQIRGSVPIFWEQATGFLPGQQKIEVTRSSEATQHAFNKHFEHLELEYGAIHVVNLLSELKPAEAELSAKFREQIKKSSLARKAGFDILSDHALLRVTEFDFHAEARGPLGYGASNQIKHEISRSLHGFAYFLADEGNTATFKADNNQARSSSIVLQQEGVFRTNCLDCLDRTNLVQTIISLMALESFLRLQGGGLSSDIQSRHSNLWADNGDALSKIYAGTGALKSSFTRHGKMSFAGALADARKTATRLYVNNFSDKARQQTIDLLLGHLADQVPVYLYDPVNDLVSDELNQRAAEYSFSKSIKIWTGTFNVNGRHLGSDIDLTPWLWSRVNPHDEIPTIFAIGFQEIVSLSPQQIMSTDPTTRKVWEISVKNCLNDYAAMRGAEKYVLLRSGQLVGTALMVFVRGDALTYIKNVEGSVKKTGLSGMAGNKGGCAIRFDYSDTRICFVTAHLAAGFANYDERNRDYETIYHGMRFQKNRTIEDHDAIIWLGDFNYRIGRSNQEVRELIIQKNFQRLYDNDQLNLQMLAGRAFQFYTEGRIMFPPTYKYDVDRDDYDTSEKARIPAWCDRILWKGSGLQQQTYDAASLKCSDHRPVWATFTCIISVVDEVMKSKIRGYLYSKRQCDPQGPLARRIGRVESKSEDLISLDSIAPGLPPASSDNEKWWLETGMSVKSGVQPPPGASMLNIFGNPNPFSPHRDRNWVDKHGYPIEKRRSTTDRGTAQPAIPASLVENISLLTNSEPASQDTGQPDTTRVDDSVAADPGVLKGERQAPPIPRKPVSLSLNASRPEPSTKGLQQRGVGSSQRSSGPAVASSGSVAKQASATQLNSFRQCDKIENRHTHLLDTMPQEPRKSIGGSDILDQSLDEHVDWEPLIPH